jgi:hypothetical protein
VYFPPRLLTYLAYAQSASFVHFLYKNYGSSGMLKLIGSTMAGSAAKDRYRIWGDPQTVGVPLKQEELRMNLKA